jgi:hypothetical protein
MRYRQRKEKPRDKWGKGREWRNPERRVKRPENGERETEDNKEKAWKRETRRYKAV